MIAPKKKDKPLGQILVEKKLITQEELQELLLLQKGTTLRLGQLILKKGLIKDEDVILTALSERFGIPFQKRVEFDDPENVFGKIPVYFLKKNKIAPFKARGRTLYFAIVDPLNIHALDDLKMLYADYDFEFVLAPESEALRILGSHFDILKEDTGDVIDNLEEANLEILSAPSFEADDILDMANEAPIIKLVNMIITQAVQDRASDIHIEPYEKDLVVRFRIDGILYQMFTSPKKFQGAIISRIKIMANLNIAENRLPQDGRIQVKIGGKDIDIRVSVFPTYFGERVVLRLLNKTDMKFDLRSLGFSDESLASFEQLIKKTYGVILVTGPTGSGKTTTLYSVLTGLKTPEINVLTVEDPIEYQLPGIGQMQVKPKIDLTFANGLRSILRQDPDVIMIGEIRDLETAEIAVQSALTGHRVFSTLHTNDAASGITRLIDMGVEPFLITSSVNAFLAQRLVRRLCTHCRESYRPSAKILNEIGIRASRGKGVRFYRAKGCDKCLKTGYSGRTGIYELLLLSNTIRAMIMEHAEAYQIKEQAIKEGMITLLKDGAQKALSGVTSIEEVLRVSQ